MSYKAEPTDSQSIEAQLAETRAALDALKRKHLRTIIDIAQIVRDPDRLRGGLSSDGLTLEHPIFNRPDDEPLLKGLKRVIHQLTQSKTKQISLAQKSNPNVNPHAELIELVFEQVVASELAAKGKVPGRQRLMGLAKRYVNDIGLKATVSEPAARKYVEQRRAKSLLRTKPKK